jgi:hypothetical protein
VFVQKFVEVIELTGVLQSTGGLFNRLLTGFGRVCDRSFIPRNKGRTVSLFDRELREAERILEIVRHWLEGRSLCIPVVSDLEEARCYRLSDPVRQFSITLISDIYCTHFT